MKTKNISSNWFLGLLLVSIWGCGGETIVQNLSPQTPLPAENQNEPTPDPIDYSKPIRIYLPNLLGGVLRITQETIDYDFSEPFTFSNDVTNLDRYIDVEIPNQLYAYDVWVDESVYRDPATNATYTFNIDQKLSSIIPAQYIEDAISITPFTHLAKMGFDKQNENAATIPWSEFENAYRQYFGTDSFLSLVPDLSNVSPSALSDSARYGLWIAALGRLAKVHQSVYDNTGTLNIRLLLQALEKDLESNGKFSGSTNAKYGNNDVVKLNHQTMRLHLAKGLYSFLATSSVNQTGFTTTHMMNQLATLSDKVTKNTSSLLFSSNSNLHSFTTNLATYNHLFTAPNAIPPNLIFSPSSLTINITPIHSTGILNIKGYAKFENLLGVDPPNVVLHSSNTSTNINYHFNTLINYVSHTVQFEFIIVDNCLNKVTYLHENAEGINFWFIT